MSKKSRQLAPSGSISVGPTFSSNEAMSISSKSRVQKLSSSTCSSSESLFSLPFSLDSSPREMSLSPLASGSLSKSGRSGISSVVNPTNSSLFSCN